MKILLQWTVSDPSDWVELDLRATGPQSHLWRNLPKHPVPTGLEVIDNTPGWLFSANIQGVDFYGFDHVAAEPIQNGIRMTCWNDDPEDHPARWGEVWELREGWADRTLALPNGGTVRHRGPDQMKTVYAEDLVGKADQFPVECGGQRVELKPWSEFPMPSSAVTLHGVWVRDDALWQRHFEVRREVGWRDWMA